MHGQTDHTTVKAPNGLDIYKYMCIKGKKKKTRPVKMWLLPSRKENRQRVRVCVQCQKEQP